MSNYSATSLQALTGSLIGLSTISMVLRLLARRKLGASLWMDDLLVIIAYASFLGIGAVIFEFVHIGALGLTNIPPAEQDARLGSPLGAKLQLALVFLDVGCLACSKASACFLYWRLFNVHGIRHSLLSKLIVASIITLAIWLVAEFIALGTMCDGRFSALWELQYYHKYCGRAFDVLYGIVISDMVLDIWTLALPIIPVCRLHVSLARKLAIIGIFLLGAIALGSSIARLVIFAGFFEVGASKISAEGGQLFYTKLFFYYTLECGISIIAVNLPLISPMLANRGLDTLTKWGRSVRSLVSRSSGDSTHKPSSRTAGSTDASDAFYVEATVDVFSNTKGDD